MEIANVRLYFEEKIMATGGRKRTRFGFDIKFRTEEDKKAFVTRLESIRDLMTPSGSAPTDNNALMYALFDMAENLQAARRSSSHTHTVGSFLEHTFRCVSIKYCYPCHYIVSMFHAV